jgi:hypothetical protein
MAYSTSIYVVYPFEPPVINSATVLRLIDRFAAAYSTDDAFRSVSIKYGRSVDQDSRSGNWWVPTGTPGIFQSQSDYDREAYPKTFIDLVQFLSLYPKRPIYRLGCSFGRILERDSALLKREPDEKNKEGMYPWDVSVMLDLVEVESDEDSFELVQLGWIAIGIYGNGRCFPWTHQDLLRRARDTLIVPHAVEAMDEVLGKGQIDPTFLPGLSTCRDRVLQLDNGYLLGIRGI